MVRLCRPVLLACVLTLSQELKAHIVDRVPAGSTLLVSCGIRVHNSS
jgi:hypothetical protein